MSSKSSSKERRVMRCLDVLSLSQRQILANVSYSDYLFDVFAEKEDARVIMLEENETLDRSSQCVLMKLPKAAPKRLLFASQRTPNSKPTSNHYTPGSGGRLNAKFSVANNKNPGPELQRTGLQRLKPFPPKRATLHADDLHKLRTPTVQKSLSRLTSSGLRTPIVKKSISRQMTSAVRRKDEDKKVCGVLC